MNAGIVGIGRFVPENIVTNADLEKRMDTSDEWIRTRTGIEERRIAGDDINTSDMAFEAAKNAIKNAITLLNQNTKQDKTLSNSPTNAGSELSQPMKPSMPAGSAK